MTTTTATITQEVKSSVEEQNYFSLPKNYGSLFPPLKNFPFIDTTQQHFDNNNMVWETLGTTKKPIGDFSEYLTFANKFYINEPIPTKMTTPTNTSNTSKSFVNPPYVNSLYYDHLINDGGSFNNGRNTKFNGCTTDNDNEGGQQQQQNPLYNMAFSTSLFLPTASASAWSSLEDLNTPTTATTNSTVTSRCSTPATSGWSFNEHAVDSSDAFVAQQQKDISTLKSRPSLQNFHLKRQPSMVDSSSFLFGNGVQVQAVENNNNNIIIINKQPPPPHPQPQLSTSLHSKVRRTSNISNVSNITMSDTTSEQSEKSPTIEAEKEQKKTTLYKTEMCRNWEERGSCRYGSKCQFAHSETELRKVQHHPKYKTEICKTFWQNGTCPYGKRCCFIHNDKERILLCKRRNSADNVKNSNKKEKSKGLSKYGSDPSLYGSYHLSDSSNSSADTSIPSPPLMNSAVTTPPSSSNEFLVAFADAYFSPNISLSPETVVPSNVSSPSTICDDETVIGSGNSSVNSTPTKKKVSILSNDCILGFNNNNYDDEEDDEIPIPACLADKPLLLSELLNNPMNDSISQRFDKTTRSQTRRRASTTSCKLEKSTASSTGGALKELKERSASMNVNVKQSGGRVINPSALASQHQHQRRLAIFRNFE